MVYIRLTDPLNVVQDRVNEALAKLINKKLTTKKSMIVRTLKKNVNEWTATSPEILSLQKAGVVNELPAQFGIRGGNTGDVVDAIVTSIAESTVINIQNITPSLRGRIEFSFQPSNFANLLGLAQGHVITQEGTDLHWMNWLLKRGDEVIITGYDYTPSRKGRSGGGTMEKGTVFRVDPRYSGTESNNFVTRLFSNREEEIKKLIIEVFNG
jgi:hypothetical protein